jgi:uncharacterized membrane protein YdjX (TVP38/TMEM64 family)
MKAALPPDRRLWWIGGGLLAASALVALAVPAHNWTDLLAYSLEGRNLAAALALFIAAYVVGTLLLLPSWLFAIAAGIAFGFGWGLAASMVASTLSALLAFVAARYAFRERVERAARRNKAFTAVEAAVKKAPFRVVALLRLTPVMPSSAKSYFLGLTSVRILPYIVASALGMFPGNAVKAYLGHAGRNVLHDGGPWTWAMLAAGVAALAVMALGVSRIVRRHLGL